jgi:hypothetical protein
MKMGLIHVFKNSSLTQEIIRSKSNGDKKHVLI